MKRGRFGEKNYKDFSNGEKLKKQLEDQLEQELIKQNKKPEGMS